MHRKYVKEIMLDYNLFLVESEDVSSCLGRQKGQLKYSMFAELKS